MARFPVSKQKQAALDAKMKELGIKEDELIEKFIRGSGSGGQKINKTSSCVFLQHPPSGIEVKCQKDRSRALNRYFARKLLCERLDEKLKGKESRKQQEVERRRRQKRKRSKRAKDKMLADKKQQSTKKEMRKTPSGDS